jgi:hypothetical protein
MALLAVTPAGAANWRYAGMADSQDPQFFDSDSVEHVDPGLVRVWVESVPSDRLSGYYAQHESQLSSFAGRRTATGYVPVFLLPPLHRNLYGSRDEFDAAVYRAVVMEAIANSGSVAAAGRSRVEIDCVGRRTRVIESTTFDRTGAAQSAPTEPTSTAWQDALIGTNGDRLHAVFCEPSP